MNGPINSGTPPRSRTVDSMELALSRPFSAFSVNSRRTASVLACATRVSATWISVCVRPRRMRNWVIKADVVSELLISGSSLRRCVLYVMFSFCSTSAPRVAEPPPLRGLPRPTA